MAEPTFDRDGYPTEETLAVIRAWPFADSANVLPFIAAAWHWDDMAQETRPGLWVFATGGWSGNESLLHALQESVARFAFRHLTTRASFHVYAVTQEAKDDMRCMVGRIHNWAWSGRETNA